MCEDYTLTFENGIYKLFEGDKLISKCKKRSNFEKAILNKTTIHRYNFGMIFDALEEDGEFYVCSF